MFLQRESQLIDAYRQLFGEVDDENTVVDLEEELSIEDMAANQTKGKSDVEPLSVSADEVKLLEDAKHRLVGSHVVETNCLLT